MGNEKFLVLMFVRESLLCLVKVKKGDGKVAFSLFVGESRVSLGKCMNGFSSF